MATTDISKLLQSAEKLFLPLAEKMNPKGTEPKALIHQWIRSIANNTSLYGTNQYITPQKLKRVLSDNDVDISALSIPNRQFTFIDLFAGIGGMHIGFEKAGGICVFSSEFEKHTQDTYFDYEIGRASCRERV